MVNFLTGSGIPEDPWRIRTVEDWNALAANVSSGENDYAGQTVRLEADLSGITTTVGSAEHPFRGVFEGDGHGLNLNLTADQDNCAPFGGLADASIRNLNVDGTIATAHQFAGSIAAHTAGRTEITGCTSAVCIRANNSGDGTHGGFVAVNDSGTLSFSFCSFRGRLLGGDSNSNGGFVGWNNEGGRIQYTDCLFAPAEVTMNAWDSCTFNRNGGFEMNRARYTSPFGEAQGEMASVQAPHVTVEGAEGLTYTGAEQALLRRGETDAGILEYAVAAEPGDNWQTAIPAARDAGTYAVWYRVPGSEDVAADGPHGLSVTIGLRPVTLTAGDAEKTYDGQPLTQSAFTVAGLADSDDHAFEVTMGASARTDAGQSANIIASVDGVQVVDGAAETGNYRVRCVEGTLTVAPKSIVGAEVALSDVERVFDGTEQRVEVTGVTLDGAALTPEDYDVTGALTGTETGAYTVTVTGRGNYQDAAGARWTIVPGAASDGEEQADGGLLIATLSAEGGKALKLTWTAVPGAEGYDVLFKKGKGNGRLPLIAAIDDASMTGCLINGLKNHTHYRACVRAWATVGEDERHILAISPVVRACTGKGAKSTVNPGALKLKKHAVTLGPGEKTGMKVTVKKAKKGRLSDDAARLRYYSDNPDVATVTARGKVKAEGGGTCRIYVLTSNGLYDAVTVQVK